MAKADKVDIEVTTTVEGYVLELTPEEAQMLMDVMSHIGGPANNSRRGLADSVSLALHGAGLRALGWDAENQDMQGNIYFKEPGE